MSEDGEVSQRKMTILAMAALETEQKLFYLPYDKNKQLLCKYHQRLQLPIDFCLMIK